MDGINCHADQTLDFDFLISTKMMANRGQPLF
jgi:hypothetical protein